jgi:hypothetical protein
MAAPGDSAPVGHLENPEPRRPLAFVEVFAVTVNQQKEVLDQIVCF